MYTSDRSMWSKSGTEIQKYHTIIKHHKTNTFLASLRLWKINKKYEYNNYDYNRWRRTRSVRIRCVVYSILCFAMNVLCYFNKQQWTKAAGRGRAALVRSAPDRHLIVTTTWWHHWFFRKFSFFFSLTVQLVYSIDFPRGVFLIILYTIVLASSRIRSSTFQIAIIYYETYAIRRYTWWRATGSCVEEVKEDRSSGTDPVT